MLTRAGGGRVCALPGPSATPCARGPAFGRRSHYGVMPWAQMPGRCCERDRTLLFPGLNVASGHRGECEGLPACCAAARRAELGEGAAAWASARGTARRPPPARTGSVCAPGRSWVRPGGGGGGGRGLCGRQVGDRGAWVLGRASTGRGYAPCVRDRGPRLHFTSLHFGCFFSAPLVHVHHRTAKLG